MPVRVSSTSIFREASQNLQKLQAQSDSLMKQAHGNKITKYSEDPTHTSRIISLENRSQRLNNNIENNVTIKTRIQAQENIITLMQNTLTTFRATFLNALNLDQFDDVQLKYVANQCANDMAGFLNSRQNNRALFGGFRTNFDPVDLTLLTPPPTPDMTSDPRYYAGTSDIVSYSPEEWSPVSYGVLASNNAFDKAFLGLELIINATIDTESPKNTQYDQLYTALGLIVEAAEQDLPTTTSYLGRAQRALEDNDTFCQDTIASTEIALGQILTSDTYQVLIDLQNTLVIFQNALYIITKMEKELSLINFL